MRSRPRSRFSRVVLAAAVLAVVVCGWWLARPWRQQWVAWQLSAALSSAPEEELPERLAELLLLDGPGLSALVDALASDREELSRAVAEALAEELERWKHLPRATAEPRVAALAAALARRSETFGRHGDAAARRIALALLDWPVGRDSADLARLTADCETVLRAPAVAAHRDASPATATPSDRPPAPTIVVSADGGFLRDEQRNATTMLDFPGGGLPFDQVHVPQLSSRQDAEDTVTPRTIVVPDERPLISAPPARLEPPYAYPLPRPQHGGVPEEIDEPPAPPVWPLHPPEENTEDAMRRLSAETGAFDDDRLLGLMQLLHDGDPYVRQRAEDALRRHGFTDSHLILAMRLTDPDPQRRIALAALLPRLPDIDARAWLLHLSRDADERVRRAALSVMSATRDPQLLDEVRQSTPR